MTTWLAPGPISHPWFKHTKSKRKLVDDDDSPVSSRSSSSPPPCKRRKQSTILEAGFSSLTLANVEPRASRQLPCADSTDYTPMDSDDDPACPISAAAELTIPEVKMKSSSWYEPEPDRIVVTSLDSSDDEEVTDADTTTLMLPPLLLKKLMSASPGDLRAPHPLPGIGSRSQALVLFKPLPVPDKESKSSSNHVEEIVKDDDAMDVEP